MQTLPLDASVHLPASDAGYMHSRNAEDVVYQGVTIIAMLLLLGSLWVF
jgi:hypothetical protein